MKKIYEIISLIIPITLIINFVYWHNLAIGILFGLIYFTWFSYRLGIFFKDIEASYLRNLLGFISLIAITSLVGVIFFYFWEIKTLQLILMTVLVPILVSFKPKSSNQSLNQNNQSKPDKAERSIINLKSKILNLALPLLYLIFTIKAFLILFSVQTSAAIQTPWQVMHSNFFILYFILTLLLVLIIINNGCHSRVGGNPLKRLDPSFHEDDNIINLSLISIHLFLTFSVTAIIYQINFGFDPFIHQATEKLLSLTGTISPKPLLYIGQYSLVVWLSQILQISIVWIDKFLTIVFAATLLPSTIYFTLTKGFSVKAKAALLTTLAFPILLLPFYFSVPQNLANLFLLLTVLISIITASKQNRFSTVPFARMVHYSMLWLLGIFTFTIHPFSGIPLLIYLAIYTLLTQAKFQISKKLKIFILVIIILVGAVVLPLALTLGSNVSDNIDVSITDYKFQVTDYDFFSWIRFNSIYHLVYLFETNHVLILGILAAIGLWFLLKKRKQSSDYQISTLLFPLLIIFFILSINASTLNLINLPIINYEIPEFTARFWQIGLLFLVPIMLFGISRIINNATSHPEFISGSNTGRSRNKFGMTKYPLLFFLPLLITMGFYLTYPRNDAFSKARAFATSQADIETVKWIEQDAQGKDYTVLSNQAVAAAALHELGFKKYYQNKNCSLLTAHCSLFFYPIPTTSPLYSLYLDMVYQAPTKKRLQQALELTGADIAYFVVNDYWLDYEKIAEQAKQEFSDSKSINNEINIYKLTITN